MASNSDRVKTIWKEKKKFCQLCCYQRRMAKTSPHILYDERTVEKLTMVTYLPWSSKTLNQFFFVILHLENTKRNFFDNLRNCNLQNWAFISAPVSQDSFTCACHSLWHVSSASFFCRYWYSISDYAENCAHEFHNAVCVISYKLLSCPSKKKNMVLHTSLASDGTTSQPNRPKKPCLIDKQQNQHIAKTRKSAICGYSADQLIAC